MALAFVRLLRVVVVLRMFVVLRVVRPRWFDFAGLGCGLGRFYGWYADFVVD